jgi:hypothetical protein
LAFDSLRFSVPSTASPGLAPCEVVGPFTTSVPLSGFLNLSVVSWQAQGSWPCFMPLPFLGSSLQSFSLTRIACPSRDRFAPLQLSTGVLMCAALCLSLSVSPTSARAVAWIPRELWTSFPRAEARFPVVLGSARRTHLVPPASPTSELSSPCESVACDLGLPLRRRSMLSWVLPLRSFLLPRLGFSTRPG